ncbi:MAG: HK97 family phage prohead protease [Candidatus Helarchaeota archaeon]
MGITVNEVRTKEFEGYFDIVRSYESETKKDEEKGDRIVEGYILMVETPDREFEIISKKAAERALESLKFCNTVLFNHEKNYPIGKLLEFKLDDKGIRVKIMIDKYNDWIWNQITQGIINSFSYRGRVRYHEEWNEELSRTILVCDDLEIFEISLVSLPAQPLSKIMSYYVSKALEVDDMVVGNRDDDLKKKKDEDEQTKDVTKDTDDTIVDNPTNEGDEPQNASQGAKDTQKSADAKDQDTTNETKDQTKEVDNSREDDTKEDNENTDDTEIEKLKDLVIKSADTIQKVIALLKTLKGKIDDKKLKDKIDAMIEELRKLSEEYGYPYPYPTKELDIEEVTKDILNKIDEKIKAFETKMTQLIEDVAESVPVRKGLQPRDDKPETKDVIKEIRERLKELTPEERLRTILELKERYER